MHWFYLLISFLLVFAAAAIADPDVVPEIVKPPDLLRRKAIYSSLKQRNCRSRSLRRANPRLPGCRQPRYAR